ncbi:Heat shock 70 kDa protein 6, chloroplastic [Linum perenne]
MSKARGRRPQWLPTPKNGDRLDGQIARRHDVVNPENTFFSVKRVYREEDVGG